MTQPQFSLLPLQGHEIHVTEWGDPGNPAVVMWHGLARTGRDFDELAAALSDQYFVICPDTIGRGLSSWARDPGAEYNIEYLAGLARDLLDAYGIARAIWIGTSMGGLIGMRMASGPLADRLACLIINDIGPEIPQDAIGRILTYAADLPVFDHIAKAETWLREVYTPFGPAPETFWRRLALSSVRRCDDGRITIHYDPRIVLQFSTSVDELTSWNRYARITTPTHVIWGLKSDILTQPIVDRMQAEGPRPEVTIVADCGHAPTLSRPEDIEGLRNTINRLLA